MGDLPRHKFLGSMNHREDSTLAFLAPLRNIFRILALQMLQVLLPQLHTISLPVVIPLEFQGRRVMLAMNGRPIPLKHMLHRAVLDIKHVPDLIKISSQQAKQLREFFPFLVVLITN